MERSKGTGDQFYVGNNKGSQWENQNRPGRRIDLRIEVKSARTVLVFLMSTLVFLSVSMVLLPAPTKRLPPSQFSGLKIFFSGNLWNPLVPGVRILHPGTTAWFHERKRVARKEYFQSPF